MPLSKEIRKEMLQIAYCANVKVRLIPDPAEPSEVDLEAGIIYVHHDPEKHPRYILSDFFHELGHVLDKRRGLYPRYYKKHPTKKALREESLSAEIHADYTGERLMKAFFPQWTFAHTYKYKKWQRYYWNYWGIE